MKKSLRSLLLATALVSISYSAAFAEMIYNRGNSADPETLDPHKTSTVYEAHILRDLFSEDQGGYLEDAALLDRLTKERLESASAERCEREGWQWTDAHLD